MALLAPASQDPPTKLVASEFTAKSPEFNAKGLTRLSALLGAIGMVVTAGAAVFTYQLLHEPLESVGASEVSHLASAKCTAIARSLTALYLARSDVQNGEPEGERTDPGPNATIGVISLGSGELEDFHTSSMSQRETLAILRRLPLDPRNDPQARSVPTALSGASPELRADLNQHHCNGLGYSLTPLAVRAYPIPGRSSGWTAFIYGPWNIRGKQKAAFALVNLSASMLAIGGHDQDPSLQALFPSGASQLDVGVTLNPSQVLKDEESLRRALPKLELEPEDQKLVGLRIVPFANQLVSTQVSIDHNRLNWTSWRAAALVFLMGSLATITVVLVSRDSEIRLRQLNGALLRESRTDGLTRIANRRAWDESLNLEESRRQRNGYQYGLVVVDLDGFKQINDEQGHQMGDQVLKIAASQLGDQMRSTDLLARVGGDEFALMVFNPSASGLDELVDRLREALQACGVQASIGAAMSEPRTTLEQTWAKADEAMYTYKPQTSKKLNPRRAIDQSGHRA